MVGRRRWLVPLLLVGMLAAPSTVIAVQLGAHSSSKRAQSNTAGRAQDYRFTAPQSGKVSRLSLYLDRASTARALELGLYSGTAGSARARLARCTVRSPRRGAWNRCVIPEVTLKKRSTYWLAVMQPKGSKGALRYRVKRGAGRSYASASARLGVLPRSWRNGPRRGASRASIVADRPSSPASPSLAPLGLAPEPVPVPNGVAPGGPARIPQPVCSLQVSGVPAIEAALANAANDGKTICVTAAGGDSTLRWSSKHSAMTTVAAIPTDGSVTLPGIDFSGANNITVQGFRLTGGTSLEDGASSIRLLGNTFSDMSSDALDIHQTGGDIWFVGNLVQNIRYTGDAFTGYGIRRSAGRTTASTSTTTRSTWAATAGTRCNSEMCTTSRSSAT